MPPKVQQFRADLRGLKAMTRAKLLRVLQEVAFDIGENIIVGGKYSPGTPVDTSFARNQWHLVMFRSGGGSKPAPAGPPNNVQDINLAIAGMTALEPIAFVNNTEYIGPLEYGHSQQAPEGMVRLTLAAAQEIVDDAVRRVNATRNKKTNGNP